MKPMEDKVPSKKGQVVIKDLSCPTRLQRVADLNMAQMQLSGTPQIALGLLKA